MAAAGHRTTPHSVGAPVLVWLMDGPLSGRHLTVKADMTGHPPSIVTVAYEPPQPPIWADGWRDAPTINRPRILTYELRRTLDTVPWTYEYALRVPLNDNQNGASPA